MSKDDVDSWCRRTSVDVQDYQDPYCHMMAIEGKKANTYKCPLTFLKWSSLFHSSQTLLAGRRWQFHTSKFRSKVECRNCNFANKSTVLYIAYWTPSGWVSQTSPKTSPKRREFTCNFAKMSNVAHWNFSNCRTHWNFAQTSTVSALKLPVGSVAHIETSLKRRQCQHWNCPSAVSHTLKLRPNVDSVTDSLLQLGVRIVKNELGGSATQQELKGWGLGDHNGMNRGTAWGLNPNSPSIRTLLQYRRKVGIVAHHTLNLRPKVDCLNEHFFKSLRYCTSKLHLKAAIASHVSYHVVYARSYVVYAMSYHAVYATSYHAVYAMSCHAVYAMSYHAVYAMS